MRLVASDIDGTILSHDGHISERTVKAFHACRDAGVEVVFVTGRPPRWLTPLQEQLGHTGTVICSNGAVVWDLESDKVIDAKGLDLATVLELRRIVSEVRPEARFAAETLGGFHLEPDFIEPGTVRALDHIVPAPLEETLSPEETVVKFMAISANGTADAFLAEVSPAVEHLATVTHSAPGTALLEISLPGLNKAVTLAEYAAQLGIDAADVVAFGDMPNDVQMLAWAGQGYAMASGHPEAIAAAGQQAPHFDDDGVAQILEQKLAELLAGR
ncbi:HAD family hydrolase [Pseudarthrobacter sp. J1738]|uniref:HAD family hydrolase n=1 Tax=unclassified Pseudarthrobacter TaxID=2647000 RepID=UPI003D2C43E7